jgi:hypothetical protein
MLKELQIGLNFFWKLFEWIRDRYEKTLIDLRSYERIVLNHLPYQKIRPFFSLRAVIHEFFQKKFNPI